MSPAPVADVGDTVAAVPPPASTSACVAEYLIVRADVANNALLVRGNIPGANKSLVVIKSAVKKNQ